MHFNVSQFFILTFKMVLMTLMFALMKVYFFLLYDQWPIWMPQSVIECWLKCKNRNWIWFMRKCSYFPANECILALLVAVPRKWLHIFSQWTAKGVLSAVTLAVLCYREVIEGYNSLKFRPNLFEFLLFHWKSIFLY